MPIFSRMSMKTSKGTKALIAIASCAAALALPASQASADRPSTHSLAAQSCKADQQRMGKPKFAHRYGKHAMRSCIKAQLPDAVDAVSSSVADCNDELATDGVADFLNTYESTDVASAMDECVTEESLDDLDLVDDGSPDDT